MSRQPKRGEKEADLLREYIVQTLLGLPTEERVGKEALHQTKAALEENIEKTIGYNHKQLASIRQALCLWLVRPESSDIKNARVVNSILLPMGHYIDAALEAHYQLNAKIHLSKFVEKDEKKMLNLNNQGKVAHIKPKK